MPKLPVPTPSHSKPNTTSSAWTRLVQATKSASKTSRHGDAKSPGIRRQSLPKRISSMEESARSVKRRRLTGPQQSPSVPISTPKPSSPTAVPRQGAHDPGNLSRVPALDRAHAKKPLRAAAECIEACPCSVGDPSLSDGRCSLSQPSKLKSVSTSAPSSTAARADLRTFWDSSRQKGQSKKAWASQNRQKLKVGDSQKGISATTGIENRETLHVEGDGIEKDLSENEPLRQSPERDVLDDAGSSLAQGDTANMTDTTDTMLVCKKPTKATQNVTSDMAARLSPVLSNLRNGFNIRQRSEPRQEIGKLDDVDEYEGQASSTENSFDETTDSDQEDANAPVTLFGANPQPASTPGLHDATTQRSRNRTPGTPMISQSSTFSDAKENTVPARKPKRRLTLHNTQPPRPKEKKRKMVPKQTVQTTLALAIGGNAGMRECKVCDTVYNPLHPDDVKVHARRHAGVLRKEERSAEV